MESDHNQTLQSDMIDHRSGLLRSAATAGGSGEDSGGVGDDSDGFAVMETKNGSEPVAIE